MEERNDHSDLDLFCFDLLAEEFWRSPDHQSRYEYRDNDKDEHIDKTYTDTTEKSIDMHSKHQECATDRSKAIVHCIHRTVRSASSRDSPLCRSRRAKSHFFSFHAATRLIDMILL